MLFRSLQRASLGGLISFLSLAAFAQEKPCGEIKDPDIQFQMDLCSAHLGCKLVLTAQKACEKIDKFLSKLKTAVGEGSDFLLWKRKEVRAEHIVEASLSDGAKSLGEEDAAKYLLLPNKSDRGILGIKESVKGAAKTTLHLNAKDGPIIYIGDTNAGKASGWGTMYFHDGEIQRGHFLNNERSGPIDVINSVTGDRAILMDSGSISTSYTDAAFYREAQRMTYVGGVSGAYTPSGKGMTKVDGKIVEEGVFDKGKLMAGRRHLADGRIEQVNEYAQRDAAIAQQKKLQAEAAAKAAEDEANKARQLAAAAARSRADFESKLASNNAGELFAMADQLSSDGKQDAAREVRRRLISRFPDHPLAATAGQQLAGAAASQAAPPSATVPAPSSTGSTAGRVDCRAALKDLEREHKRVIDRDSLSGKTIAGIERIMWMTKGIIDVIDGNCPGENAELRNQMQGAFQDAKRTCEQLTSTCRIQSH